MTTLDFSPKTKRIALVTALIVTFLGGVWVGTSHGPERVEERVVEKIVEKEVVRLVERVKTVVIRDTKVVKGANRTWKVVEAPDGTKTTEATEDTRETIDTKVTHSTDAVKTEIVEKVVTVDREVIKLVEVPAPDWRVGLQGGVDLGGLDMAQSIAAQPWVLGGSVDRRIVGPVFAGVWGNTSAQGGLGLSMEF